MHPVHQVFQFMIPTCSSAQVRTDCLQDNKLMGQKALRLFHNNLNLKPSPISLKNSMCPQLPENVIVSTLYKPDRQRDRIIKQ